MPTPSLFVLACALMSAAPDALVSSAPVLVVTTDSALPDGEPVPALGPALFERLRKLEKLAVPFPDLDAGIKGVLASGEIGERKMKDLKQREFIRGGTDKYRDRGIAVYTDPSYLRAGTAYRPIPLREILEFAIRREDTEGIAINAPGEVCTNTQRVSSLTNTGAAELLGYLDTPQPLPDGPFHELALRAAEKKQHYLVLYYWSQSYRTPRPGDDWKKCELAKLRAYHQLDFTGSRARAAGELDWFVKNHGETPETTALRAEWKKP